MMLRVTRFVAATLIVTASSGCDLLDEATTFPFCAPSQQVAFDSSQIGLTASGATIPDVACNPSANDCEQAGAALGCSGGTYDCTVTCVAPAGSSSGSCEVTASFSQVIPVDISSQVSSQTQANALSKVTLTGITYGVQANDLNFDTPAIDIYVGPGSATTVTDPGVALLGTIEPIAAGDTFASKTMQTEAAGRTTLTELVKDYRNAFHVIVVAQPHFSAGQDLPTGALQMEITPCFEAQLL